jgi:HPt (histidine-containing phosphotransfer) domain-containing protein
MASVSAQGKVLRTAVKQAAEVTQPEVRHRPIDMVHLSRQTLGDAGLEGEVLRLFDQMVHIYFGRLEASTSPEDQLRHLHTIKGAAGGIGAFMLADLARTAEAEVRQSQAITAERVSDIGMAVQEVSSFIGDILVDDVA